MSEHSKENPEVQKYRERQATWDRALVQLEEVEDALGRPVDEGIRDAIVAFEVNGFHSNSSCEGHVREQFGYTAKLCPYVSVGFNPPEERFVNQKEIQKRVMDKYGIGPDEFYMHNEAFDDYWAHIQDEGYRETEEYAQITQQNLELWAKLLAILSEFYEGRPHNEETVLILAPVHPFTRVTTRNGDVKKPQGEDEIAACQVELEKEQVEMKAFTEFMKKRFFNS